jgi:hypothetical protein
MSALEILKGKKPSDDDADLELQLADVREVARDGAARLGKYMVDTVEVLTIEALSCWEGFAQFCSETAGVPQGRASQIHPRRQV